MHMEWLRFVIAALFILIGVLSEIMAVIGVFKFKHVLSRMHASAIGDTVALLFVIVGVCIITGLSFTTLKLILVVVFLWLTSPISSHLISMTEVKTNDELEKDCEVRE